MSVNADIILASASPRRGELLQQIGVRYLAWPVVIDETVRPDERPGDYVCRVAAEKSAAARCQSMTHLPVLGADTVVVLGNSIMGKPENRDAAVMMLLRLSGITHQVFSAVSLRGEVNQQILSVTQVSFRALTEQEALNYWTTGEPVDKAGGYAIQGLGSVFVKSIRGSYSGVVGLPVYETAKLLAKEGINIFHE